MLSENMSEQITAAATTSRYPSTHISLTAYAQFSSELVPVGSDHCLGMGQCHAMSTDRPVGCIFDRVFRIRRSTWLRPEVFRVSRISTQLQANNVVFLKVARRAGESVLRHLVEFEPVCVADRWSYAGRVTGYTDRLVDDVLGHSWIYNTRATDWIRKPIA